MASQDVSSEHICFRCQILNVSHSTASESLFSFPVVRFYLKTSTVEFQGFSATYLDRATCWPRQETKRRRGGDPWLSDQAAKKKFSLDHPRPKLHKLKFQIHLPLHCALLFQGKKKKKTSMNLRQGTSGKTAACPCKAEKNDINPISPAQYFKRQF